MATTTRASAVIEWLTANPGPHRPVDVARGVGITTHQAAACLTYLSRGGRVLRHRSELITNGPGSSTFSAP